MPRKRASLRSTLRTILLVGEGPHDQAFLQHMKSLYVERKGGVRVTVKAADGGGAGKIIDAVCRRYSPREFDQAFILMDEDVPISQNAYDKARKNNISVLSSTPYCLEGMLLDITGQPVGEDSRQCKKRLQEQLAGPPTVHESYARLLTRERLDGAGHPTIKGLRNALLGSSAF